MAEIIKVSELIEDSSPSPDDLVMTVNDPSGNPGSRKVKLRDLHKGLSLTPTSPDSLTAVGGFQNIFLSWSNLDFPNLYVYEVWRSEVNDRASAVMAGEAMLTFFTDYVGVGVTRYYWVRPRNISGIYGAWYPFSPTGGIECTTVQVTSSDLIDASIVAAKLADSAVIASKIAAGVVDGTHIANLAVDTAHIKDAAIQNAKIGDLQVLEAKIANLAVTTGKIADLAVNNAKIANLAVDKLLAGTIGAQLIYLGDTTFALDGSNKCLLVKDTQGAPANRVKIGKLGAGATDYGIEIKNASGRIILGINGLGVYFEPFTVGDNLVASAPTERLFSGGDLNYIKYKEISLSRNGTLRIKFDLKRAGVASYATIYRNGAAVGTERYADSSTYTTWSEDISGWSRGDLCQLYCRPSAVYGNGAGYIRNFKLYAANPHAEGVNLD